MSIIVGQVSLSNYCQTSHLIIEVLIKYINFESVSSQLLRNSLLVFPIVRTSGPFGSIYFTYEKIVSIPTGHTLQNRQKFGLF